MTGGRDYRLDLLRIIAASIIVLRHSPMPGSAPGMVMMGISYFTEPGVGLFFMISGALLLNNTYRLGDLIKRRFSKILFPTLFWTVFYLVVSWIEAPLTLSESVKIVMSIPFSAQGHGILWFMYALAGLYLLTPILSKWLSSVSKREVEFYLLLWGITLLYPYLSQVLFINETNTGVLYNFAGYSGYFLFGYYLRRYYNYRMFHVVLAVVIAIAFPALLFLSDQEFDYYSLLGNLSMPVVLMAFCWFVLICRIPNRQNASIYEVSRLSFGIYLVHIFFMREIVWNVGLIKNLPYMVQIPAIAVITFALSFAFSWLISRLPISKYIIGA